MVQRDNPEHTRTAPKSLHTLVHWLPCLSSAGRCAIAALCAGRCAIVALCAGRRVTESQYASHSATDSQCRPLWSTWTT